MIITKKNNDSSLVNLPNSDQTLIPINKKGNKINIKKENKGKFTKYCNGKVTEECISKGKRSSDPKIRKRATFADNARKWAKKYYTGGAVFEEITDNDFSNALTFGLLVDDPKYGFTLNKEGTEYIGPGKWSFSADKYNKTPNNITNLRGLVHKEQTQLEQEPQSDVSGELEVIGKMPDDLKKRLELQKQQLLLEQLNTYWSAPIYTKEGGFDLNQPATMNYISSLIDNMVHPSEIEALLQEKWLLAKNIVSFTPAGDILDAVDTGKQVWTDIQNGNYGDAAINAAIGTAFILAPEYLEMLGRGVKKGAKALHDMYSNYKNVRELKNIYKRVGTGLSNPYVRSSYNEAKKDPNLSLNFLKNYSLLGNNGFPVSDGLTIELMEDAIQKLDDVEKTIGVRPRLFTNKYDYDDDIASTVKSAHIAYDDKLKYLAELDEIEKASPILANIAKESPQYLRQIYADLVSGKVTDVPSYVSDLITQSNTFLRRMNVDGEDLAESFTTIGGRSHGVTDSYSIDVGNIPVVFDPLFGRKYGNTVGVYTPKWLPTGDVSTWWSQRFPKFADESITAKTGMHTGRSYYPEGVDHGVYNRVSHALGVPYLYGLSNSHIVFRSPNKGASISDMYDVKVYKPGEQWPSDAKYSLGFKNGGEINTNDSRLNKISLR